MIIVFVVILKVDYTNHKEAEAAALGHSPGGVPVLV